MVKFLPNNPLLVLLLAACATSLNATTADQAKRTVVDGANAAKETAKSAVQDIYAKDSQAQYAVSKADLKRTIKKDLHDGKEAVANMGHKVAKSARNAASKVAEATKSTCQTAKDKAKKLTNKAAREVEYQTRA